MHRRRFKRQEDARSKLARKHSPRAAAEPDVEASIKTSSDCARAEKKRFVSSGVAHRIRHNLRQVGEASYLSKHKRLTVQLKTQVGLFEAGKASKSVLRDPEGHQGGPRRRRQVQLSCAGLLAQVEEVNQLHLPQEDDEAFEKQLCDKIQLLFRQHHDGQDIRSFFGHHAAAGASSGPGPQHPADCDWQQHKRTPDVFQLLDFGP